MLVNLLRGTTEENNQLLLPAGTLSVNTDDYSLRFHDGQTLGGFEIKTRTAFDLGPGPRLLKAGDWNSGFLGEMTDSEFFSGPLLTLDLGVSEGTAINPASGWLKFVHQGKVLFVAKKPLVRAVSWDTLYRAGAVYGIDGPGYNTDSDGREVNQLTVVVLDDHAFKVRLLTGADTDPADQAGGEFNALLERLASGWASGYNASALGLGQWELVQETYSLDASRRVARRPNGFNHIAANHAGAELYWRPVLELIPKEDILFEARGIAYAVEGGLYPLVLEDLDFANVINPVRRIESAFVAMPGVVMTDADVIDPVNPVTRHTFDYRISELIPLVLTDPEFLD